MAKVDWTVEATSDVIAIRTYIAQFHPSAAERMAKRLIEAALSLENLPNRGRPTEHGFRELLTIRPYIIRYRVYGDQVTILGVRHGARLSPEEQRRQS